MYDALHLPDIAESIYESANVPEAITRHIKQLKAQNNFRAADHISKFQEFRDQYIMDRLYRSYLRDTIFNALYDLIDKKMPDLCFFIEGRTKSLIKFHNKLYKLDRENRSTDLLRDQMAFRIVIYGIDDKDKLISKAREVMEICAIFCVNSGFSLCDLENLNLFYTGSEAFMYKIKDYYAHPKPNGYMSLHSVYRQTRNSFYGRYFELQVLTLDSYIQNELIENSPSSHRAHNEDDYGEDEIYTSFDPKKVTMKGFVCDEDGNILLDVGGVYKSSQILYRKKSF